MLRAVFLDRDDTLVAASKSGARLFGPGASVRLLPGVAEGLTLLKDLGFLLVVATNQPSVALGYCSRERYEEINAEVGLLLTREGAPQIDLWTCCDHPLDFECGCRKPRPGLLTAAAAQHRIDLDASHMVGDEGTDVHAGQLAGTRSSILVWPKAARGHGGPRTVGTMGTRGLRPYQTARSFDQAARMIADMEGGRRGKIPGTDTAAGRHGKAGARCL